MRTTLNIDDDVLKLVHRFAESRSVSLGKAISKLARRGLAADRPVRKENGLYVIELPEGSPAVTSRHVQELESMASGKDDVRFSDAVAPFRARLVGHRQVTDAYLLGLAQRRRGRLVTLDRW